MEDSDMKAIREIANGMEYVASEAVDKAPYDVTRNARITKVYLLPDAGIRDIIGYDITCDGKPYHIDKERGKGIIAEENDIVKLHIPCNNMNNVYLSYAHDPEDYIKYFLANEYDYFTRIYSTGIREESLSTSQVVTFPATTKQFSSVNVEVVSYGVPYVGTPWRITVATDNGTFGVVQNSEVHYVDETHPIIIKLYNENPTTTSPVTKSVEVNILMRGIWYNYITG